MTEAQSEAVVNIAAYKFVRLDELERRRADLMSIAEQHELLGTILLSEEGMNLFLSGTRSSIDGFLSFIRQEPRLTDLDVKESLSQRQPFERLQVRIRPEIITFGVDGLDPEHEPAPRISARDLKAWLDAGKPLTLLDTRNDYEVEFGTFDGAINLGIESFREFPRAVSDLPHSLRDQPIVMFCTGGIRCEKAGPYLQKAGFQHVFQLDGGILKYFEECGGPHWTGECFVFDDRISLDPGLHETPTRQCVICQGPHVPTADQSASQVCPRCALLPAGTHQAARPD